MKLTIILLTVTMLNVSAKGVSQTVTYSGKQVKLQEVLSKVEQQTGFVFFYPNTIKDVPPLDINMRAVPLPDFLDAILKGSDFMYIIKDRSVFISQQPARLSPQLQLEVALPPVNGVIRDTDGNPLAGVNIVVKGTRRGVVTDTQGRFSIKAEVNEVLVISSAGYNEKEIKIGSTLEPLIVSLVKHVSELNEVTVKVGNTGYQVIDKNHPGSFDVVKNELIDRRVSTDVLSRIENLTTGVSFRNANDGLLIRGRNSIFSNVNPLIVLDNFPYDGDINNINPNDIESITILKDAAASAVWGARAGNGVIVLTTKKGKSGRQQISLNTNVTVQSAPDIKNVNTISSAEFIDLEKYLFDQGHYQNDELDNALGNGHPIFTPVVELLIARRDGLLPDETAIGMIESMKDGDIRSDIEKYFYRTGLKNQNALNLSGGAGALNYYFSAGWDKNRSNLVSENYERVSLRNQTSFKISRNILIETGLSFAQGKNRSGNNPGYSLNNGAKGIYPYARLIDENANELPLLRDIRAAWRDSISQMLSGKLLNWSYYPISDINNSENAVTSRDLIATLNLRYTINAHLYADIKYQYGNTISDNTVLNKIESYFTRSMINRFYQPGAQNEFPVSKGGIRDISVSEIVSHQGRAQLNFNQQFGVRHNVTAIAGFEIKDLQTTGNSHRVYGYQKRGSVVSPMINFEQRYTLYDNPFSMATIPNPQATFDLLDRFVSYYFNGSYTYDDKFSVVVSQRNDAANLFGVSTNQKGVPLWSAGAGWIISNEKFYGVKWIPFLKVRASYGHNGNFSRKTSAFTTIQYSNNSMGLPSARIINPPNKELRWEQVGVVNMAVDFSLKNNRVSGRFEYYRKHNKDLMAQAPIDPTTGLTPTFGGEASFFGNTAHIKGSGYEIELNSVNINTKAFVWRTNFLFSCVQSKISKYLLPAPANAQQYLISGIISPIVNKPVFNIYSFPWGGLDDNTGDPVGFAGKARSTDYDYLVTKTPVDSLIYNGVIQPPYFGALRNTFEVKNLSLSFNISYKMGYYFRKTSVNYGSIVSTWTGSGDYNFRWRKPGDEMHTSIPSLVYPANNNRDFFYANADVLVIKGDHIRLDDIRLSYTIPKAASKKGLFQQLTVYTYFSDLGVLWTANTEGIDPYYYNIPRNKMSAAVGINVNF